MKTHFCLAAPILLATAGSLCADDRVALVEHSKPIARSGSGLGATRDRRSPLEEQPTRSWSKAELNSGSPDTASLQAQFVRDWDWKLFAFMLYGTDHSNPQWI